MFRVNYISLLTELGSFCHTQAINISLLPQLRTLASSHPVLTSITPSALLLLPFPFTLDPTFLEKVESL